MTSYASRFADALRHRLGEDYFVNDMGANLYGVEHIGGFSTAGFGPGHGADKRKPVDPAHVDQLIETVANATARNLPYYTEEARREAQLFLADLPKVEA